MKIKAKTMKKQRNKNKWPVAQNLTRRDVTFCSGFWSTCCCCLLVTSRALGQISPLFSLTFARPTSATTTAAGAARATGATDPIDPTRSP